MPREFDLIGLGNSLVDILLELTDDGVRAARLREGDDAARRAARAAEAARRRSATTSRGWSRGGSVANSVIACSQLGGEGAFIGCVGDDRYGLHYAAEFDGTRHRLRQPAARRRDDRHLREHHHARRRADDADLPGGVEPPRGPARPGREDRRGRVALRRGLRLRQPAHRPARDSRGDPRARRPPAPRSRSPARTRSCRRSSAMSSAKRSAQSDLLFCNATEAVAVAGGSDAPTRRSRSSRAWCRTAW